MNDSDDFSLEHRLAMLVGSSLSPSAETYGDSEEGMVIVLQKLFEDWDLSGDPQEILYDVAQYMGDFELLQGNEDWLTQNLPVELLNQVAYELQVIAESENADISDNPFIQMYGGTVEEAENEFIESDDEEEDEEIYDEDPENPIIDSDDGEGEDEAHRNGGEGCSM